MFKNFKDFIKWEKETNDTIDVKKIYIDVAEDVMAGIMLSQMVYWYLPNKEGKSKLKVKKKCKKTNDMHFWIAKSNEEWYEEIRFSKANIYTAYKNLEKRDLIIKQQNMFDGTKMAHIRLNVPVFLTLLNEQLDGKEFDFETEQEEDFMDYLEEMASQTLGGVDLPESRRLKFSNQEDQSSRIEKIGRLESRKPITENTTKTTTEITNKESIYLEKIEKLDLPVPLKEVLKEHKETIDRLIRSKKMKLSDVKLVFKAGKLNVNDFATKLDDVLNSDITKSFKSCLNTAIDNFIANSNKKAAEMKEVSKKQSVREEILPDWFENKKQDEKPKEAPKNEVNEEMVLYKMNSKTYRNQLTEDEIVYLKERGLWKEPATV